MRVSRPNRHAHRNPDLYGMAVAMFRDKLFEPLLEPRPA